jgi:hypothetical protein
MKNEKGFLKENTKPIIPKLIQSPEALKESIRKVVKANIEFQKRQLKSPDTPGSFAFPFLINPTNLEFNCSSPNTVYSLPIEIINKAEVSKRLTLQLSNNDLLSIGKESSFLIKSEAVLKLSLVFKCQSVLEMKETITLICDDLQKAVTVTAVSCKDVLRFDKSKNLGEVGLQHPVTFEIDLTNVSEEEVVVNFEVFTKIKVYSDWFPLTLKPAQHQIVIFHSVFDSVGSHFFNIFLFANDKRLESPIKVMANATTNSVSLSDNQGREITFLNLGELFIENEVTTTVRLINNTTEKQCFSVEVLKGFNSQKFEEENFIVTPFKYGSEALTKTLTIEPSKGQIDEFGSVTLTLCFKPVATDKENLLINKFSLFRTESEEMHAIQSYSNKIRYTALVIFTNARHNKSLKISAETFLPFVRFSLSKLVYGKVYIGESKTQVLTLENCSPIGTVTVATQTLSFIHTSSSNFVLRKNESKDIELIFKPKNLGLFTYDFVFLLNESFRIVLHVSGQSVSCPKASLSSRVSESRLNSFDRDDASCLRLPGIPNRNQIAKTDNRSMNQLKSNDKELINNTVCSEKVQAYRSHLSRYIRGMNKDPLAGKPGKVPRVANSVNQDVIRFSKDDFLEQCEEVFLKSTQRLFEPFPDSLRNFKESKCLSDELTPGDLKRIQISGTEMNFGRLFMKSKKHRYFMVKNNLFNPILVSVESQSFQTGCDRPRPDVQAIPIGETAGFKITVASDQVQHIRQFVFYTINKIHQFNFLVVAEFVEHDLALSRQNIEFKVDPQSSEFNLTEKVELTNHGNCSVNFEIIEPPNSTFKTKTGLQSVGPQTCIPFQIVHTPSLQRHEEVLTLKIANGPSKSIRCSSAINEAFCEIVNPKLNLGEFSICKTKKGNFLLRNLHTVHSAVFQIDPASLPKNLKLHPMKGRISQIETFRIDYRFFSDAELCFHDYPIKISVRGLSAPLTVFFSAACIRPVVTIAEPIIDFGCIFYGTNKAHSLTLANHSSIPVKLYLDISFNDCRTESLLSSIDLLEGKKGDMEDVKVLKLEKRVNPAQIEEKSRVKNGFETNALIDQNNSTKMTVPRILSQTTIGSNEKQRTDEFTRLFVFYLKPLKTYNFYLEFSPPKPKTYEFELLFFLRRTLEKKFISRTVRCLSQNRNLFVEPLNCVLDFQKVIIREGDTSSPSKTRTLTLTNPHSSRTINWKMDSSGFKDQSDFLFSEVSGSIEPLGTVCIKVDFCPTIQTNYQMKVPIHINVNEELILLKLAGEGCFPKPVFPCEDLILPTVPLGVTTWAFFKMKNYGYVNGVLQIIVPEEAQQKGLAVEFIGSNSLSLLCKHCLLKISCTSKTPLSFTASVLIRDQFNRKHLFNVSVVIDNSILSCHAFFHFGLSLNSLYLKKLKKEDHLLEIDDSPKDHPKIEFSQTRKTPVISLPKDSSARPNTQCMRTVNNLAQFDYFRRVSKTIFNFLCNLGITSVTEFPKSLIAENGMQITEFLELANQKQLFIKSDIISQAKGIDRIKAVVQQYSEFLIELSNKGAFVSNLRPQFLLSLKDYQIFVKNRHFDYVSPDYYNCSQEEFNLLSLSQWTSLFSQMIGLFHLSSVTSQQVKANLTLILNKKTMQVPANSPTTDTTPQTEFKRASQKNPNTGSNFALIKINQKNAQFSEAIQTKLVSISDKNEVFSNNELLLLAWVQLSFQLQTDNSIELFDFVEKLKDHQVLYRIVEAYTDWTKILFDSNGEVFLKTKDECEGLRGTLDRLGMRDLIHSEQLADPVQLDLLFLVFNLFKMVPAFVPKSTITFELALHEKLTKEVTLSNTSNRPVSYQVSVLGHANFKTDLSELIIEPRQSVKVPLTFSACSSQPAFGILVFQNQNNGKARATSLVFNLRATITRITLFQSINFDKLALYECQTRTIQVFNPFDIDSTFKIAFSNELPGDFSTANKHLISAPSNQQILANNVNAEESHPPSHLTKSFTQFFTLKTTVFVKSKTFTELSINFHPFILDDHVNFMRLSDSQTGEFNFELRGKAILPKLHPSQRFSLHLDEHLFFHLMLFQFNDDLIKTLQAYQKLYLEQNEPAKVKRIEELMTHNECLFDWDIRPSPVVSFEKPLDMNQFPDFTPTNNFYEDKGMRILQWSSNDTFKLKMNLSKAAPIQETMFTLILKSKNRVDVRVIPFSLTVFAKILKKTIQLKTPVRIPVTSTLNVSNTENENMPFKIIMLSNNKPDQLTVSPSNFVIKKNSNFEVLVVFNPQWLTTAECVFQILNLKTDWSCQYHVTGVGEDPVYETNEIIKGFTGETIKRTLKLVNPVQGSRDFLVSYDLPELRCPSTVTFRNAIIINFDLSFIIQTPGSFMHSLKFTDSQGRYFWYLLTIQIEQNSTGEVIRLQTEQRKPVSCAIPLKNNSDTPLRYKVEFQGSFLYGDEWMVLPENSARDYTLLYFPLKVETELKKVSFKDENGALSWFSVECSATEPEPVVLSPFNVELGKSHKQTMRIKNPLKSKQVILKLKPIEVSQIKVSPTQFAIPPTESAEFTIEFTPDSIGTEVTACLTFETRKIGTFKYIVRGLGLIPKRQTEITFQFVDLKTVKKVIDFHNPYAQRTTFQITVENEVKGKEVFALVDKLKEERRLEPKEEYKIVLSFNPTSLQRFKANVRVRNKEECEWVYPVTASLIPKQIKMDRQIKTVCGTEFQSECLLVLGQEAGSLINQELLLTWNFADEQFASFEKWVRVDRIPNYSSINNSINVLISFLPFKPFETQLDLIVKARCGFEMKFFFDVSALEPPFFDTIKVTSQINCKKIVSFVLYNFDKKVGSEFKAHFTLDSDFSFQVETESGFLEPAVNQGTKISIIFQPTNFSKMRQGILIVETDQYMWRFLVKGFQRI